MRTVEHYGKVVEVSPGRTVVEFETPKSCGLGVTCACCSGEHGGDARQVVVRRSDLKQGEHVRLQMPVWMDYVAALVLFALPIALFIVGAVVALAVDAPPHGADVLVGGAAGAAVAVLIAIAVNRKLGDPALIQIERVDG